MPNQESGKNKSNGGPSDPDSNRSGLSAPSPDASSAGIDLRLTSDFDTLAHLGQEIRAHTLTLRQVTKVLDDAGQERTFVPTEAQFFLKELYDGEGHGRVVDTNARAVFRHGLDAQNGQNQPFLQDTIVGVNANWESVVYQVYGTQMLKDGQNANFAVTSNPNGFVGFVGGTWNPPHYRNADGGLTRFTGDIQVETPHHEDGIAKFEIKGGVAGEHPKVPGGNIAENGYNFRVVSGFAARTDGLSAIFDGSLQSNETTAPNANERERRSCQFNLTGIIAQPGADYSSELKGGLVLERERTKSVPESKTGAECAPPKVVSRIWDAYRIEGLTDLDDRYRLDLGYQRTWGSGTDGSKKEFRFRGHFGSDDGKSEHGFSIEIKIPWGGSSYNEKRNTPVPEFQLPATEPFNIMPDVETGIASTQTQGPFEDSALGRYLAAVKDGNGALVDQLANEFAQSSEGQRMAQQSDRLLVQGQAQDQPPEQAQVPRGPVMRI